MKLTYLLPVPFLMTAACQTTVRPVAGPDGGTNFVVTCSDIEYCYDRAAEMCGRYQIVNTTYGEDEFPDGYHRDTIDLLIRCDYGYGYTAHN